MFKKGVSSLIATILLIGITIGLSLLVVNWAKDSVEDQTDNPVFDIETREICRSALTDFEFVFESVRVNIQNKGPNDFSSVAILWTAENGSIGYNSLTSSISGFGFGNASSDSGVYSGVKVIPYVSGLECDGFYVEI
ncbi:hypothetical protein HON86_03270 [Candidatus Woesearchaeota archaeon]|jgi:flagellin-like protein|nr:hypothetical protein [Candidatus Woesearchaeota archaeon]MBT6735187.1 hypothetical protein [Candidatus Woesearchaeota archaeon]MBT7169802.1 hypothetical protein [Candidatus Woesearchaeota archaeon]MBT7474929.1 hypothetical protein [Candidatus Woesearchaeota archaeon]